MRTSGNLFIRPWAVILGLALLLPLQATAASDSPGLRVEKYRPGIWVDPDGCEHWVMDDGIEGYMTPHITPDGKPVCRERTICGNLSSDVLFVTNSAKITAGNQKRLFDFFTEVKSRAAAVIISGHTDSRASDAYNERLSQKRADAVADVAQSAGVQVYSSNGYGESMPVASNKTAAGMAKNRRVEIVCLY